jgi:hypothetical protein
VFEQDAFMKQGCLGLTRYSGTKRGFDGFARAKELELKNVLSPLSRCGHYVTGNCERGVSDVPC